MPSHGVTGHAGTKTLLREDSANAAATNLGHHPPNRPWPGQTLLVTQRNHDPALFLWPGTARCDLSLTGDLPEISLCIPCAPPGLRKIATSRALSVAEAYRHLAGPTTGCDYFHTVRPQCRHSL